MSFAFWTCILLSDRANNLYLRWYHIELFAYFLADAFKFMTFGTMLLLFNNINNNIFPQKVCRKLNTLRLPSAAITIYRNGWRLKGDILCLRFIENAKRQLPGSELAVLQPTSRPIEPPVSFLKSSCGDKEKENMLCLAPCKKQPPTDRTSHSPQLVPPNSFPLSQPCLHLCS